MIRRWLYRLQDWWYGPRLLTLKADGSVSISLGRASVEVTSGEVIVTDRRVAVRFDEDGFHVRRLPS